MKRLHLLTLLIFLYAGCASSERQAPLDPQAHNQQNQEEFPPPTDRPLPPLIWAQPANGQVLISLEAFPGSQPHTYQIEWASSAGEFQALDSTSEPWLVHDDLENGREYLYRATAINDLGESDLSRVVSARPFAPVEVFSISVEMDAADLEELYTRDPRSNDQLAATVRVGNAVLPVDGLRFRGSTTRLYDKKGFNIRLSDRPELAEYPNFNFRNERREAGNRVLLNAMWTDPSAMREAISFAMYRHLGMPASDTYFADVSINGVYEGLYIGIERIDREALRGWGLQRSRGEFTLVRDQSKANRHLEEIRDRSIFGYNIDQTGLSDEELVELLQEVFDYRGEIEDHDWEGLLELIRWSASVPAGDRFATELAERFDLDHLLNFLAIHILTHDRDSLDIDFWLYRDESVADPRWIMIPWDKNLTFGAHYYAGVRGENDFLEYDIDYLNTLGNGIVRKLLQTPSLRRQLDERVLDLMEVFDAEWLRSQTESLQQQVMPSMARVRDEQSFQVHPAQNHSDLGRMADHVQALQDFLTLRYAYLRQVVSRDSEEEGQAEANVRAEGEEVILVDASGWVLAIVRILEMEQPGFLRIAVADSDVEQAIGKEWTLESEQEILVELQIFYRNAPERNWFRFDVASGSQWHLHLGLHEDEGIEWLDTRANAYSNRLSTTVWLPAGVTKLVAGHPGID